MTHPDMSKISSEDSFQKELQGVEKIYKETTGKEMEKFYRPPQGIYSTENLAMAKELGYSTFFWSLAYVDWIQDQQPSREEALSKLLTRVHPGAIVLLHNTPSTNGAILDELGRNGIFFSFCKRTDRSMILRPATVILYSFLCEDLP